MGSPKVFCLQKRAIISNRHWFEHGHSRPCSFLSCRSRSVSYIKISPSRTILEFLLFSCYLENRFTQREGRSKRSWTSCSANNENRWTGYGAVSSPSVIHYISANANIGNASPQITCIASSIVQVSSAFLAAFSSFTVSSDRRRLRTFAVSSGGVSAVGEAFRPRLFFSCYI